VEAEQNVGETSLSLDAMFIRETARKASEQARRQDVSAKIFPTVWKPAFSLAMVAVIAGLTFWRFRVVDHGPEQLVARAYEQNRTWPIRIPGAAFISVPSQNRAESRGDASLSEAEARVTKALDRAPTDGHLLDLKSRIDMVRHRYNE